METSSKGSPGENPEPENGLNAFPSSEELLFQDTVVNRLDAVRVFIDCARCDINYIRQEIPYVNYVRDVREAQVYILETGDRF